MLRSTIACLFALVLTGACTGDIVMPGPQSPVDPVDPGAPVVRFDCNAQTTGAPAPLHRLSVVQYRNTLSDLFATVPGVDVRQLASAGLAKLPPDDVLLSFSGIDNRLSESHVEGYYDVADALSTAITQSDAALRAVAGACATQAPVTAACVNGLLDALGARAYRRPLGSDERARYLALNDGSRAPKEVFRAILFSVLMAPQFLYHLETSGTEAQGQPDRLVLSAHELAARLSYHFLQSMPDAPLLALADSGALLDPAEFQRQVIRLSEDPRARTTLDSFYREWFQLGRLTTFRTSDAFTAFAQGTSIGQAGADHLQAADEEILDLTRHFTWAAPRPLKDLFTTDLTFTRSAHLAAIYGVEPWNGQGPGVQLDSQQRSGLLTRMAFLTSGTHVTHPIHRGAVVRRRVLCEELEAPPAASLPDGSLVPPAPNAQQTTRTRFENKVLNEPCAGCHKQMNPIGYVLEQYDAIGRFRTQEKVLDEISGALLNTLPVDSAAVPQLTRGDQATVRSGHELSLKVAESGKAEACFARQYFRFTHRRFEAPADACALERVRTALDPKAGTLKAAFIAIAEDESFRTRKLEQP